jgi:hypothetical protein
MGTICTHRQENSDIVNILRGPVRIIFNFAPTPQPVFVPGISEKRMPACSGECTLFGTDTVRLSAHCAAVFEEPPC